MNLEKPAAAAARLRTLRPIDRLSQSAFKNLLRQTVFRNVSAGKFLYSAGNDDDWTFYLLDGTLELVAENAQGATITSGDEQSRGPIGPDRPRQHSARARSDCIIARIPRGVMEVLAEPSKPVIGRYEVDEITPEGALGNELLEEIVEDYENDNLKIPSLPDIAVRMREAVGDPDVTAREIEQIVTADPAVAARLVQVANSPAYAGTVRVESCRDAVTRLGLTTTRELVTSLVLKQLFKSDAPQLKECMLDLWQHSTRVAAISYQLGKSLRGFSPDRALLAGLVHDIGALPVLAAAQRYEVLLTEKSMVTDTVRALRAEVGAMVLRHWEFADDLVEVALGAEQWHRDAEQADYCDVVLVAQLLAAAGTAEFAGLPRVSSVSAFTRLDLGSLSAEGALEVLDQAQAAVDDLQRVLAG